MRGGARTSDALAELNKILIRALTALGAAGEDDQACRLGASAWSVLRHEYPREAQRLNALLHALTRTTHKVDPTENGGRYVQS